MLPSGKSRATREQLEELHALVTRELFIWFKSKTPGQWKPYHLQVARQFLADNNIRKDLAKAEDIGKALERLAGIDLPFESNSH